jgi:hypothetical protein
VSTDPQQFDIQLVNQVSDGSAIDWWIRARLGRRTRLYNEVLAASTSLLCANSPPLLLPQTATDRACSYLNSLLTPHRPAS